MLSILITARNEKYLYKTITSLIKKSIGDIEVIVVLDGYWPHASEIVDDKRVKYIHFTESRGLRAAINAAAAIAKGEYILKCDAHVLFDERFDSKLLWEMKDNWIVVPRRYRLEPEKWEVIEDGRPPVDYEYIDSSDLHGVRWEEKAVERKDIMVDDIISAQGSCWMMKKSFFDEIGGLDESKFGKFFLEFQELSFKCLANRGRVVVTKNTWYAHWHKTKGRGYSLDNDRDLAVKGLRDYFNEHKDIVTKFLPMPTW